MKPIFLTQLGLGMVLLLSPAWGKHVPTVTEFPTPTPNSLAEGVDVTRDGSIWYCETLIELAPDGSV